MQWLAREGKGADRSARSWLLPCTCIKSSPIAMHHTTGSSLSLPVVQSTIGCAASWHYQEPFVDGYMCC